MLGILFLRKMLGLTGEDFGKRLGVSKGTISQWESGMRKIPDLKKEMIETEFGCPQKLLEKEIGEMDKIEIQYSIINSDVKAKPDSINDMVNQIKEIEKDAYDDRINNLRLVILQRPEAIDLFEKLGKIMFQKTKGKYDKFQEAKRVIDIVLSSVEKYLYDNNEEDEEEYYNKMETDAIDAIVALLKLTHLKK